MNVLDQKINAQFPGLVVRKDLVKAVKGNAIVPSYVLEYLLGQYCATSDEASIQSGIETVKEILARHYVHRNEAGLVRSNIRERGRYKIIDKVSVDLNDKKDVYEAKFANLGISDVLVNPTTIKQHPKLLVGGVWCIADIEYAHDDEKDSVPWVLDELKPIQLSSFDMDGYLAARAQFTTEEWIDLLIQSIGFEPEMFGRRSKLIQLTRLIPFCERNYNLIELGPKGTGKSHIYSEFSPHGILISGGEVTAAKLFVNNASGKIGLVGYWDCVAFDEFAGKKTRVDTTLVDIMKNYMANKSFSRGVETLGAEASMVFVGNTAHTVPYMLKHEDLFSELPSQYYDSAFLDRLHFYIPGWEVGIIRGEMFSEGYGFVVDYLAEILRSQRDFDFSDRYQHAFTLSNEISTRDRDGVHKTFSGLMKIIYPHGEARDEEVAEILNFAIEGRKRVKDQLLRIDATYEPVRFSYTNQKGEELLVTTLEEEQYPAYYHPDATQPSGTSEPSFADESTVLKAAQDKNNTAQMSPDSSPTAPILEEQHLTFVENQKGVSYDSLFGPYLSAAKEIVVTDPYIRLFYQVRNFMEFLECVVRNTPADEELTVRLITAEDDFRVEQQAENLDKIVESATQVGLNVVWEFRPNEEIHARHIVTDHGWKILLDRGLDIFQRYEMNDAFSFSNRLQSERLMKATEITYLRDE